ncbi:MAG: nuclear transport factor 2 family protein [Brachymonas sp.]|nr:nuclear transport factor 2 family protein [Brachymonas sp.]
MTFLNTSHNRRATGLLVAAGLAAGAASSPLSAQTLPSSDPTQGLAAQVIREFIAAGDQRDVNALENLLHPEFRILFATTAGATTTTMPRAQYLQLLRDGKLGGKPRKLEVGAFVGTGGHAVGTAVAMHDTARFDGHYALVQRDGRWQIAQETVLMTVSKR